MSDDGKHVGEEKILATIVGYLDRAKLAYQLTEEAYCTKITVQHGANKAFISIFNTGKITLGGPDNPVKKLLAQLKEAVEKQGALPGQLLPFEISRFPETIKERVPDCDPVIIRFVEEAIRCLEAEALLGCAFMLGAASEKAVCMLIQTYGDAIGDEGNRAKFRERTGHKIISKKFDEFVSSYKGCKSRPTDPVLSQDLETIIGQMFQYCRITRNEVGHPQIVPDFDRGVLVANLGHFVTYIERVYKLMAHFKTNGVTV
jgi:hypothetical protein